MLETLTASDPSPAGNEGKRRGMGWVWEGQGETLGVLLWFSLPLPRGVKGTSDAELAHRLDRLCETQKRVF